MRNHAGMRSLAVLAVLLSVLSCSRKDMVKPNVEILAPLEGTAYQVGDTVIVSVTVSDNSNLEAIAVKVVNMDLIPVADVQSLQPAGNTFSGTVGVVLSDRLLETDDYYILVVASDGKNEQLEYRKIRITAMPKERIAVFFSDINGSGSASVYKVDSSFHHSVLFVNAQQDILQLCVNSVENEVIVAGKFGTRIVSYSTEDGHEIWSDAAFASPSARRFMGLSCTQKLVYATLYDRELRAYGPSGALTAQLETGIYRPETIYADDRFLVIEQTEVGTSHHFLFVYNAATMAFLWQTQFSMDITNICKLQNNKVLVFGNDQLEARVFEYDMSNNSYWEPRQLPATELLDAVRMDGQTYALACRDELYVYTYDPNYLNQIGPGIAYQRVRYDQDRHVIVAATSNLIEELSLNGQVLNIISHTDSIGSLDILYTR